MENITNYVGIRFKSLRNSKGLTQEQLGEKVNLPQPYIGGIERGEKNISLDTFNKIIVALEVSPMDVFEHFEFSSTDVKEKALVMDRLKSTMMNRDLREVKLIEKMVNELFETIDSMRN